MTKLAFIIAICLIFIWPAKFAQTAYIPQEIFEHTGAGILTIFNTHSDELETVKYKSAPGEYLKDGLAELNRLLRCRNAGEETDMSLELIELVANIQDHFSADRIDVISGYRSPAFNANLRSRGHKVARESLHMQGMAMDIKIPGVSIKSIRDYAKSLKSGGVGYYAGRFVHVDVGPVRYW